MPHAREALAGRAVERKEKRSGVIRIKIPAQSLNAIDLKGDLLIRQGNNLALGKLVSHARLSRCNLTASRMRLAPGAERLYVPGFVILQL